MPGCQRDEFLRVERNLFEYASESGISGEGVVREDSRKAYLKARPDRKDIESIELFFREHGNPYTIWMPENGHAAPCPELAELGLNQAMSLPAMVADLNEMRLDSQPPGGCSLLSVNRESDMGAFARAAFNGYELPFDIREKFTEFILNMDPSQHPCNEIAVAMRGEEPVASGLMFRGSAEIGLYWISVVPHQRNRGMGTWLTQELLRVGKEEGYQHAVLQSSPAAASVYRRLGFREVGNFQVYSH
jgi:GNAT superfamily N-acetyltransferase